TEAQTTPPPA
nr:Chain F, PSGL-1-like bis-T glycopeptide [synthetic construct]7YX8_H Chain H, PSGL-1-like bis-T glycopeptide [synthetic construct]